MNKYKNVHVVTEFNKNWYEYAEFETTDPIAILLQRNGFFCEAATYICSHQTEYVTATTEDVLCLRKELLTCGDANVVMEALDIILNA